jgi:hypothetical protein
MEEKESHETNKSDDMYDIRRITLLPTQVTNNKSLRPQMQNEKTQVNDPNVSKEYRLKL